MGMIHQIRVIGRVPPGPEGTYRVIDGIYIPSDDPSSDKLRIASQAFSFFKANHDLIQLELARAETLPDNEWSRNVREEYWQCNQELKEAEKRLKAFEDTFANVNRLKHKTAQLEKELEAARVPQFPVVRMCLLLAVLTHHNSFLYRLGLPRWNSAPDDGGKRMWQTGCLFLDITKGSFAFVVPSEMVCGWARQSTFDALKLRALSGKQYLTAFGVEKEYEGPVRVSDNAEAAPVMSLKTIQKIWPSFPPIYQKSDYGEEEDDQDWERVSPYNSDDEIFRDETQHTDTEAQSDKRYASEEEQKRKLATMAKIQDLLTNYTKNKLSSHRFEDDFVTLVDDFVRAHAEQFTPTMSGTIPLLLTALGHQAWKLCYVSQLNLSRFPKLPGDTVVKLVRAIVDGNMDFLTKKRKRVEENLKPLELLDISFNQTITPDHVARILDMIRLDELRIWDNPGLAVSDGRIAKLTNRERFLDSFQRLIAQQAEQHTGLGTIPTQPAPPMGPGPAQIRQLVWMTIKTNKDKDPMGTVGHIQLPSLEKVSLAKLDVDRLSQILHPRFHDKLTIVKEKMHVFAETIAFPLHDVWAPLDEVYTSAAHFEKAMTTRTMIDRGHKLLYDRWPLMLPLLMATGCESDSHAITSPFPEIFAPAWVETLGNGYFEKQMRKRGFDAIEPGEFTLVFLHEPDLDLVHYAIVTRRPDDGQLDVRDPAAAAREAGDERAAQAWDRGFPAQKEGEESKKQYVLIDADAVEKMLAASTTLAKGR